MKLDMTFAMAVSVSFLCLTAALVLILAFSWHKDKGIDFDLRQTVIDSATGKIAIEKVGYMTALCVSTWGFVALTLENHLSEWYFTAYISAFAAARIASQGLSVYKDMKSNAGNATQPNP